MLYSRAPPGLEPGSRIRVTGEEIANPGFGFAKGGYVEHLTPPWYRDHLLATCRLALAKGQPAYQLVRAIYECRVILYWRLVLPVSRQGDSVDIDLYHVDRVLGFEHRQEGTVVRIPIGDVYAGRTVDVLSRLKHPAFAGADIQLAEVSLHFTDEGGDRLSLHQGIGAALVKDERVAAASAVSHVVEKAEKARTAVAYLDANDAFNSGNAEEGERILKKQLDRLQVQSQALGSAEVLEPRTDGLGVASTKL